METKNEKYHNEDTIEKRLWRAACVEAIREQFPNGVPADQKIVILGAVFTDESRNIIGGSEVDLLLRSGLVKANQIVSVDCDEKVTDINAKNKAGVKCETGWLDAVIESIVKGKQKIAVVNADFMDTHIKMATPTARIMRAMSRQRNKALLMVNINSLVRNSKNNKNNGQFNALEGLSKHQAFRLQIRQDSYNRSTWEPISMTINNGNKSPYQKRHFNYVSSSAPMSTVFLTKRPNPDFVCERENDHIEIEVKQSSDKRSAGARKAWETRRKLYGENGFKK
jgi:hypothetical protein